MRKFLGNLKKEISRKIFEKFLNNLPITEQESTLRQQQLGEEEESDWYIPSISFASPAYSSRFDRNASICESQKLMTIVGKLKNIT